MKYNQKIILIQQSAMIVSFKQTLKSKDYVLITLNEKTEKYTQKNSKGLEK